MVADFSRAGLMRPVVRGWRPDRIQGRTDTGSCIPVCPPAGILGARSAHAPGLAGIAADKGDQLVGADPAVMLAQIGVGDVVSQMVLNQFIE